MRLLIFTQYYPPEMGAPQARLNELARRLRDKGHTITVLTAMPNYPTGKVFDGYRWTLRRTETIDGIRVVRTCIWPSKSSRTLPRLLSYLSFVLSSVLLGIWGLGRQDVVLFESPPLFIVPAGLLIGRWTRGRIVMNVSDIWPDIIVRMGHTTGGLALKMMFWLEKYGYEHADVVALTNPGAAAQVQERFPHVRTTVISNGVDTGFFRPELRSDDIRASLGAGPGDFLVGYCGLHGLAQGLEVVVGAADLLQDRKDIKLVMIGDGPTKDGLVAMARAKGLTNLAFFTHRPKKEMPALLASCDASLVPLLSRLPGTMPSKVYEALSAATVPLVAKGCEGDTLVSQFNAGKTFEPMDAGELAAAIRELADHPDQVRQIRANCLELAKRFDRNVIAERTNAILEALAGGKALPDVSW
jgi:colanic acid biosynthesis glycosyl transferase WcaI